MDHVAKTLGMDVEAVKRMNFYKQGQVRTYDHFEVLIPQCANSDGVSSRFDYPGTFICTYVHRSSGLCKTLKPSDQVLNFPFRYVHT